MGHRVAIPKACAWAEGGRWTADVGRRGRRWTVVSTTRGELGSKSHFRVTRRIRIRVIKPERAYSIELIGGEVLPLGARVNPSPFAGKRQVKFHDRSEFSSGTVFVSRINPILCRSQGVAERLRIDAAELAFRQCAISDRRICFVASDTTGGEVGAEQ